MNNYFSDLSPTLACEALRGVGVECPPQDIVVERREHRWVVALPDDRIAWFAASDIGGKRLAAERRVLRLIAERCTFTVPRVLCVSDLGFDIRRSVPGRCDPWSLFERCKADPTLAAAVGRSLGAILAEQHTRIHAADLRGWLRQHVEWPEAGSWIRARLAGGVDDTALMHGMEHVIERYEAVRVAAEDHVLVHGDVGFHNLALDPRTDAVNGIFDYDSAAWADRHHDFRYLAFDVGREDMLDAALAIYEPSVGRSIDRSRVRLYNAACAISFLALRQGTAPDQKSCGRTLAEDLRWVRTALATLT
jgi:aminoglycoside phosphotransferase (APT) family kinase protein